MKTKLFWIIAGLFLLPGIACGGATASPTAAPGRAVTLEATDTPAPLATDAETPRLPTVADTPTPAPLPTVADTPAPTATPAPLPTVADTPVATDTPVPPTPAPAPTDTSVPALPTDTPLPTVAAPVGAQVVIVAVDKRAEFVDIQNAGGAAQDLAGWHLLSEKGSQDCPLGGVIQPGETLRIWALAGDAGQSGFNCGFGSTIWNNDDLDPAVLYDATGREVDRFE